MKLPSGVRKKNGGYEKRFSVDGKRYSVYAASIKELENKELEKRTEIKKGINETDRKITLDTYYQDWIKTKEKAVKGRTVYIYNTIYNNRIKTVLGKKRVVDISRKTLKNYISDLEEKGVSKYGINRALLIINMILQEAVFDGIIEVNPASTVKRVKCEKSKATETIHRALTVSEQQLFLEYARDDVLYEVFAFLLLTGLRIGEACALTWSDIDYFKKVIKITKTVSQDKDGKKTIGTPKSKTSIRIIPLTDDIKKVLSMQRKKTVRLYGTELIPQNKNIFISTCKRTLSKEVVKYHIDNIVKRINADGHVMEHFSVHAFRDTFATNFIENGNNPQTLKKLLGHSSFSMTMDLYSQVMPDTLQKEMENMKSII